MTEQKKLSFAEMRGKINADANNSHLSNLAYALDAVSQQRRELDKIEKEITDMAAAVEAGDFPDGTVLRELYDRAHGHTPKKRF
ncbi:hypothetical protein [Rhizobium favelukesii]|nr:hypothetical protein [Rhizobium favelukesii]MCS0459304.1 hypothetical protein [Rhizobium favelukesii]